MKKVVAGLLLTLGCVAPALAADPGQAYVSVDYGPATYTNATGFPNPGVLRIAGGMNFSPNFGAEVGYSIFGSSSISGPGGTASIDSASSLQFLAVGIAPVSPQFEIFGKLGIASNSYTLSCNTAVCFGSATFSKTDLMFGVGAKFNVSRNLGIEAQYLNYGAFDSYSVPLKASSLTIGAVFGF
jgi:opacity protein-like surface antigen